MTGKARNAILAYRQEVAIVALLLALMIYAAISVPEFLDMRAQIELSTHIWEVALLALPMTLIIITAGIDLSVGSTMALSAVVLGLSYQAGLSPWAASGLAVLTGTAAGALNGLFVAHIKVHPLIVTLATLAAFRGIAEGVSLAKPVSGFPQSFAIFGQGVVLGVPVPAAIFIVAATVAAVFLAKTPGGRSLYAIGCNETASRFSGINVDRIKLMLYTLSGSMAGLAAAILVSRRNTAKADIATGMELDVITAVVLGGTSIFGGKGRIIGTLLGVVLIHEAREFVSWRWETDEYSGLIVGIMLIVSVLFNSIFLSKEK